MGELLDNRDFAALIKFIDCQLKKIDSSNPIASVNLILSRGGCYHQLGIYRKALKVRRRMFRFEMTMPDL